MSYTNADTRRAPRLWSDSSLRVYVTRPAQGSSDAGKGHSLCRFLPTHAIGQGSVVAIL